jgi:hypothetical protein
VSFAAITLCVASQRVFVVFVAYFVIDSVRKLFDTPSYIILYRNVVGLKASLGPFTNKWLINGHIDRHDIIYAS